MSNITKPIGGSTDLVANEAHVRQHLTILTKRWPELDEPVQFEIRCRTYPNFLSTINSYSSRICVIVYTCRCECSYADCA